MFINALKFLPQRLCWRYNNVQLHSARAVSGKVSSSNEANVDEADLLTGEIFDHSRVKHQPADTQELLRTQKKAKTQKRRPQSAAAAPAPLATATATKKKLEPQNISTTRIIDDASLGLQYVRLASEDPLLGNLMTTARSRKRRTKEGQIVLEGRRLISEALACQLPLKALIFSQLEQLEQLKDEITQAQKAQTFKIYKVPHHDLKMWSTLSTPPGVLGIFERPAANHIKQHKLASSTPLPITVVCDNVREPNNLGSIIRTCAALPCQQVVVTRGCCDPWESKALRGGCGGHFRVPIVDHVDWEEVPLLIPPETADNCCVFVAESKRESGAHKAQVVDYTSLERVGAHNVVLIGGESHGVSGEAYEFLQKVGENGKCLHIPLANGVESLNVASALTLILYELKKQVVKQAEQQEQKEIVEEIKE